MIGTKFKNFKRRFKGEKGFTLVELIVILGVFVFIIGGGLVIFVSIVKHQRKILSQIQLLNEISYVQEYMSKALRMAKTATIDDIDCLPEGYVYLLTRPDEESGLYQGIRFINQSENDACQEFFSDKEDTGRLTLKELKNSFEPQDAFPLLSEKVKIEFIKFSVNGADGSITSTPSTEEGAGATDESQPRVTILIGVKSSSFEDEIHLFQTTISQRNLNAK